MATLPEVKKRIIIQKEPNTSAAKIIDIIKNFDNISLDDFPKMDSTKREFIQEELRKGPRPAEQNEWKEIERSRGNYDSSIDAAEAFLSQIGNYIRNWEGSRPEGNHVNEANSLYDEVESYIQQYNNGIEEKDWNNLDIDNNYALLEYLTKYPKTSHKKDIDDLYWSNVNKEIVSDIDEYLNNGNFSLHKSDANKVKSALIEWIRIKNSNDIFQVCDYIRTNAESPFSDQAKLLLISLKQQEIAKMKSNPSQYEVNTLMRFLSKGVFTEFELINHDVLTEKVLETLRDPDVLDGLPDMQLAIDKSVPECKEGYTDVYFFGIPSTGKTCILMGLSMSSSLHINLAHGGGEYAAALQQYTEAGITVPATKMGFATTLEATINNRNSNSQHKINLVEMAGEDFARKIAGNQERIYDFDSMGTGVTDMLKNDNKKVFFLIIDPTTSVIRYNRREIVGYNEETGEPIYDLVNIRCNQQTLITKMVDLFAYPGNAEIMKKVDSIHIIITKADLLGNDPMERDEKALQMFKSRYGNNVIEPLLDLCKEYNINVRENSRDNYCPKLYTFSLGKFYVGGLYEYDPTDSNKLVSAIKNSTETVKKKSFWDKVIDKLN